MRQALRENSLEIVASVALVLMLAWAFIGLAGQDQVHPLDGGPSNSCWTEICHEDYQDFLADYRSQP